MFNLLDARGAISVSERVGYIGRVRKLARRAAQAFAELRAELGYPLIKDADERARWLALRDEAATNAAAKTAAKSTTKGHATAPVPPAESATPASRTGGSE